MTFPMLDLPVVPVTLMAAAGMACFGLWLARKKETRPASIQAFLGAVFLLVSIPLLRGLELQAQDERVWEALEKGEPVRVITIPLQQPDSPRGKE